MKWIHSYVNKFLKGVNTVLIHVSVQQVVPRKNLFNCLLHFSAFASNVSATKKNRVISFLNCKIKLHSFPLGCGKAGHKYGLHSKDFSASMQNKGRVGGHNKHRPSGIVRSFPNQL